MGDRAIVNTIGAFLTTALKINKTQEAQLSTEASRRWTLN
jgi:hypothetical protein